MTITEQVRDHFRAHPGLHFDNAMLRVALDIDEAQQISVALNALHNAGELKREKKEGHGFDYWVPASHNGASPAPISPKDLVARLAGDRAAKASKPEKKAKRGRPAKALTKARPGVDAGGGYALLRRGGKPQRTVRHQQCGRDRYSQRRGLRQSGARRCEAPVGIHDHRGAALEVTP